MALRTDYTDAVWSGNKKYKMIYNTDGTVSFEDVTEYTSKENSFFGAKDANEINDTLNNYKSLTDQNTSDIAVINEHISGGDLDATTWGGLTQDTATNNTTSTQILVHNGTKVQVTNANTLVNLVPMKINLSSYKTSLVTTEYDGYIMLFGKLKLLHINAAISANGTLYQNIPSAYRPTKNANFNAIEQRTYFGDTGNFVINTSGAIIMQSWAVSTKFPTFRQNMIYY